MFAAPPRVHRHAITAKCDGVIVTARDLPDVLDTRSLRHSVRHLASHPCTDAELLPSITSPRVHISLCRHSSGVPGLIAASSCDADDASLQADKAAR
jgi:hypothetical protein|tara:strand:+ start:331 stop:621 length:291 start_codon:yes stop_codon:yes gene_type:complete